MYRVPFSYKNIIRSKLPSSYPDFLLDNVALMSIDKNKSSLVGSYSFAYPQFPSDIDLREVVDEGYTYEGVVDFFKFAIQKKVLEIQSKPFHWVMEIKIGFNPLYPNKEVPMRWSVRDIMNGYIVLEDNSVIDIKDAIRQKSVINMEVIGVTNNKFTDMSTFFALVYRDKKGALHSVNLPDASVINFPSFYVKELKESIAILLEGGAYAKIVKRLFSLGKFIGDSKLINKIAWFINSPYAIAGQKRAELTIISKIIKFTGGIGLPIEILTNQLMNIKNALSNVIVIPDHYLEMLNKNIDKAYNIYIYEMSHQGSIELQDTRYIDQVAEQLYGFVNEHAEEYLETVGLLPMPDKYLP
jgi:hypothetical protein